MASGNVPDDVASICSVCLEPYKGRNPKLLPCFHTLCLPCLKDLEKHHTVSQDLHDSEDDKEGKTSLTFPCPTCRAVITVPSGGVTQLQTSFSSSDETQFCDLCDRSQEAKFSCTDCGKMCEQCEQCHGKITSNHLVQPLTSSYQASHQPCFDACYEEKLDEHLTVLEAVLATMREEEDTLQREGQEVADVISRRADAVRALVTQAEEQSQRTLAKLVQTLSKQIREEKDTARQKYGSLFQLSSKGGNVFLSRKSRQTGLLSDDDFQYFQQRCTKGRQMLSHLFNDCAIDLQAVEAYLAKVCDNTQPANKTSYFLGSNSLCSETKAGKRTEGDVPVIPESSDTTHLTHDETFPERDQSDISTQTPSEVVLENLQQDNSNIQLDLAALSEEHLKIQKIIAIFQDNFRTVREKISSTEMFKQQEFESLRTIVSELRNDVDSFHKESSIIKQENTKVQDAFETLRKELKSFKEKSTVMVAFAARLSLEKPLKDYYEAVVFNEEICNIGQAYDKNTGVFTVPVTGMYFFLGTAIRNKKCEGFFLIIFDDKCKVARTRSFSCKSFNTSCTVHTILRLREGQTVSLQAKGAATLRPFETSFCGVLLQPQFDT